MVTAEALPPSILDMLKCGKALHGVKSCMGCPHMLSLFIS
jgi:hypothetical protein